MLDTTTLCLLLIILFIILFIVIIVFISRKVKGGEIPSMDTNQLYPHIDFLMRSRGWQTNIDPYKGKITVTKDSFVATDIYLKKQSSGKIEILHGVNAAPMGWVLVVICVFIGGIFVLIPAIALHMLSRKFAKKEVIPLIVSYPPGKLPPMLPFVPPQVYACKNCRGALRHVPEHDRWYCDKCRKYA